MRRIVDSIALLVAARPRNPRRLRPIHAAALLLFLAATPAMAQTTPVNYSEDFQSFAKNKNVPGWVDGKVGELRTNTKGKFKTAGDPLFDNYTTKIVFGTTK